jgi:hypothetical protein
VELQMTWEVMWNAALTLGIFVVGWIGRMKEKEFDSLKDEVQRLNILLNRTREEVAKEYVTKSEVHADINRVLESIKRLDDKIERLMEGVGHAQCK